MPAVMPAAPHSSKAEPAPVIVWFRDDLRVSDHPALAEAARSDRPVVCLYVLDEESEGLRPLGGAARWWLAGSLRALARALDERGARLVLRRGPAVRTVAALADETGAGAVYWNRRAGPGAAIDDAVEAELGRRGIERAHLSGHAPARAAA